MSAESNPSRASLEQAADAALRKFLPLLSSPTAKVTQGFAADDDLKAVTTGDPVEAHILPVAAIGAYAGGSLEGKLQPSSTWYFPVRSRGQIACLVSVARRRDGALAEDKLGMAELARAWDAVLAAWPASKGFTPVLVVVPSHQRFYFTVPQAPGANLTRLRVETPEAARPGTHARLTPVADAMAELRP